MARSTKPPQYFTELNNDLQTAVLNVKSKGSQYTRRVAIRTFLTYVEGMVNYLWRFLTEISQSCPRVFSLEMEEAFILSENSIHLRENGELSQGKKLYSLSSKTAFVIKMMPRISGTRVKLKLDGPDWKRFKDLIEIRHRITHPFEGDLQISDADLEILFQTMKWFQSTIEVAIGTTLVKGLRKLEKHSSADNSLSKSFEKRFLTGRPKIYENI